MALLEIRPEEIVPPRQRLKMPRNGAPPSEWAAFRAKMMLPPPVAPARPAAVIKRIARIRYRSDMFVPMVGPPPLAIEESERYGSREPNPTIGRIIGICAREFSLAPEALLCERRTRCFVVARHVAMYLANRLTLLSGPQIGRAFGGRDHTTVLNAVRRITAKVFTEPDFAARVAEIERKITGGAG